MLTHLAYNLIVNTSVVKTIEPLSRSPENCPRCRVTFVDGTRETIIRDFDQLDRLTEQVIPAPAGFQVVRAYMHDDGPSFGFYPVLAFRLADDGPFPICHWLRHLDSCDWALVWPDGRCEQFGCQLFDSVEAFKAALVEQSKPEAEANAEVPSNG